MMTKPATILAALGATAFLVAAGCSSDDSSTKADDTKAAGDIPWEDKSHEQQEDFMKEVIKPEMSKLLQAHDAEEFAKVTCKTCHGKSGPDRHWEMPTDELPKLDPTDKFAAHQKRHGEMLKFMMDTFTPKMVELLGVEPWSPDNPKGFGCFSCHTMAEPGTIDSDHDSDSDSDHDEGEHAEGEEGEASH